MSLRHYLRRPPAISAAEAVRLVEHGALVVDVRRQFEWNRVHIPGACTRHSRNGSTAAWSSPTTVCSSPSVPAEFARPGLRTCWWRTASTR